MDAIKRFKSIIKIGTPTTIAFTFADLIFGILAITYLELAEVSLLMSSTTLLALTSISIMYRKMKKRADDVEEFVNEFKGVDKIYGANSILISIVDVLIGIMIVLTTSLAVAGVFTKTIKICILGSRIGGRVIQVKKSQNLYRTLSFSGVLYGLVRKEKFLVGVKDMFKKLGLLLWGNKVTGAMTGALSASFVFFQTILPQFANDYIYAAIAFVLMYILACLLGGEYLYQIVQRFAEKNLSKEKLAIAKANEKKALEITQQLEKAKRIVKEYENAKALLDTVPKE